MKKFVSMFLAVCAVSTAGVPAFAQQAEAINVSADRQIRLTFGEEDFEQMLLPGKTYSYPLYVEQNGIVEALRDEHLKDLRIRAMASEGKEAVSEISVEEKGDTYHLQVTTKPGWPTEESEVEGMVKIIKRSNGQTVASAEAEMTVGYPVMADEDLEGAKYGESILVNNEAPVITEEQFEEIDQEAEGGKVSFTNGEWRYDVRISGQESVNMLHNHRAIREITSTFEDQNFKYVSFPGGPKFFFSGKMTIDVSDEMEDFGGNFYVYRYLRGVLERIDSTTDKENETVSFETKTLGRFVLTDKEIPDGTIVDHSFVK